MRIGKEEEKCEDEIQYIFLFLSLSLFFFLFVCLQLDFKTNNISYYVMLFIVVSWSKHVYIYFLL